MYNSDDTRLQKLFQQIDNYVMRYGRARIGVYLLPNDSRAQPQAYPTFINSLFTSLKRYGFNPVYQWTYFPQQNAFILILTVLGYFRNDLNDITQTVLRIWNLHYPSAPQILADLPLDSSNAVQGKNDLWNILQQIQFDIAIPRSSGNHHLRYFGSSHFQ